MTAPAIAVEAVSKEFRTLFGKKFLAVDRVSFTVERGSVFGLLGANGTGKTTILKILLDLTRPTAGRAEILGEPVSRPASRQRVGYLPEGHRFPGYLTARQTLEIFNRMSGLGSREIGRRVPDALSRVGLAQWAETRVKKFSKGMTQRLGLAAALLHDPEVLLLDEPTDGVDPAGRREIRDLLKSLAAAGKAVLINSHLLSEIELTCDRIAILKGGRVAAAGTLAELTRGAARPAWRLGAEPFDAGLADALAAAGARVELRGERLLLYPRDAAHLNELIDLARARGCNITELAQESESLEDVFIGLARAGDSGEGRP